MSSQANKVEIPPVHPTTKFEKRGLEAQPVPVTTEGMNLFDYFAAHAPEMPKWYRSSLPAQHTEGSYDSYLQQKEMDLFIQWRIDYATSMCVMRNQMFSQPKNNTIQL